MAKQFEDGETVHFVMGSGGTLYIVDPAAAECLPKSSHRGTGVIERVDPDTNTIWFTSPLPEGVA